MAVDGSAAERDLDSGEADAFGGGECRDLAGLFEVPVGDGEFEGVGFGKRGGGGEGEEGAAGEGHTEPIVSLLVEATCNAENAVAFPKANGGKDCASPPFLIQNLTLVPAHRRQELRVRLCPSQLVEQQLHTLDGRQRS